MNRQDPSCQILLKIYTKRQNRQDVFIDGVLIPASNSVLEADGTLSFSNPDPSIHIPQVGDGVGVNFFDRTEQILFVNVQGNSVVRVIVAKTLVVEFQSTNTELTADELYDSENLRFYLASILGIDISKIKVSYGLCIFTKIWNHLKWGSWLTELSMEFDKIHLKDSIVTWPDMHSFLEFDKFEPISNS